MKKIFRIACLCAAYLSLACGIAPLFFGVFHAGMLLLILFGGVLLAEVLLWHAFDGWGRVYRRLHEVCDHTPLPVPIWWRRIRMWIAAALTAFVLMGCIVSGFMFHAAYLSPAGETCTVIVLGCRVLGEEPSLMLQRRLDAALLYLNTHPRASVIVTGGLDRGEIYTEAEIMKRYLRKNGIEEARIYMEDRSTNTKENMSFAKEFIDANQLPGTVAIATDGFHELRSQIYAKQNGLVPSSLPAVTPWGLLPSYWVREWMGLAKAIIWP